MPISMYFIFFKEIMEYIGIVPNAFPSQEQYMIAMSNYMRYGVSASWTHIFSIAFTSLVFVMFTNRGKNLLKLETHYLEGILVLFAARGFFEIIGLLYGSSVESKWYLTVIVSLISLGYFIFEKRINKYFSL